MLVYEGIKSDFMEDVDLNQITDKILKRFKEVFHRGTGESEVNSWRESMLRMRGILADDEIPDNAGVAIEFNIPHTSNRIDFLLSGYDKNKNNSIIIIELKQWTHADAVEGKDGVVSTVTGRSLREVTHPSYQAWSYASLIDSYIQASSSYENLTCAFSMITEYVQSDFNTILLIIIKNYEKINKICVDNNKPFKINDYIIQKYEDDLTRVQNSLITIGQFKLNYGFEAIDFRIDMWDMYLIEGKNPQFLEFLKSHLIQTSLYLSEINKALSYIIKYTNKNFVTMLELFVKNYDKIEAICIAEKKYINIISYIQPNGTDNIEGIKQNLNYIIARKMKANYETLYFKIDIWLFYINNGFNNEFLLYLEKKLFEGALYYDDILDCLTYASTLRNKTFATVLEMIINNFEKIHIFIKNKKVSIDFSHYFVHKLNSDNIEQIYKLICIIIEKERIKNYKTVNFKISIWEPYSNIKDLNVLRYIRKIILQCYIMDKSLTERDIDLARKIHDVGFLYIRQGKLVGDKLLEFLGVEEAFYVEGQINDIIETNKYQQKQLDEHLLSINYLKEENIALKRRVSSCESDVSDLRSENNRLKNRVSGLEDDVSTLYSRVRSLESSVSCL